MNLNFLILDTETGDSDPNQAALLTVGLIAMKDGQVVGKDYIQVLPEDLVVTSRALEVNGIDMEEHMKVAIPRLDAAQRIKRFVYKHFGMPNKANKPHPVGHNINYDMTVLFKLFAQFEMDEPFSRFHFDTRYLTSLLMLCGALQMDNAKLDGLLTHYGINLSGAGSRHNAADDAAGTLEVFIGMVNDLKRLGLPVSITPA